MELSQGAKELEAAVEGLRDQNAQVEAAVSAMKTRELTCLLLAHSHIDHLGKALNEYLELAEKNNPVEATSNEVLLDSQEIKELRNLLHNAAGFLISTEPVAQAAFDTDATGEPVAALLKMYLSLFTATGNVTARVLEQQTTQNFVSSDGKKFVVNPELLILAAVLGGATKFKSKHGDFINTFINENLKGKLADDINKVLQAT